MPSRIVVAYGQNREIGANNQLLWQMPADIRHFREVTADSSLVMGRRTFQSIGRALPGRENIVISRNPDFQADGILTATSLEEALGRASRQLTCIIGGGQIYQQALEKDLVDEIYATEVQAKFPEADSFFPTLDDNWQVAENQSFSADQQNPYDFSFISYQRKRPQI